LGLETPLEGRNILLDRAVLVSMVVTTLIITLHMALYDLYYIGLNGWILTSMFFNFYSESANFKSMLNETFLKNCGNLLMITDVWGHALVANLDPMTAYLIWPFYLDITCTSKQPVIEFINHLISFTKT
jgi:hypothetical protein